MPAAAPDVLAADTAGHTAAGHPDRLALDDQVSADENRSVAATVMQPRAGAPWTVWLTDMDLGVAQKLSSQTAKVS